MRARLFLFLPVLLAAVPAVRAQPVATDSATTIVALDPIVVTGAPYTGVSARRIQVSATRGLAGLLRTRSSAYVVAAGDGATAGLSIRGAGPLHTVVFLDGVRLSDPHTGQIDLAAIPTMLLSGVSVQRGGAASGGSLGGTVHLSSASVETARARVTLGSFGERSIGAASGFRSGAITGSIGLEAAAKDGDFPVRAVPGGPSRRLGAAWHRLGISGSLAKERGRWRYATRFWGNRSDRNLPGPANTGPRGATQRNGEARIFVTAQRSTPGSWLMHSLAYESLRMRFADEIAGRRDVATARVVRVGSQLVSGIGGRGSFGVEVDTELWEADGVTGTVRIRPDLTLAPGPGSVTVAAGFASRGSTVVFLPAADASWRFGAISLRTSAGRAVRFPTLTELFWEPGGNAALKPERGWTADGGVSMIAGRLETSLGAFTSDLEDRIVWQPALITAGMQVWTPRNIGRVRTYGLEGSADVDVSSGRLDVDAGFEFDWIRSIDRSDRRAASFGNQLRYQPSRILAGWMDIGLGRGRTTVAIRHVGPRPIASDGSDALPAYTIVDAGVGRDFAVAGVDARAHFEILNALDAIHEALRLYPMPGRAARFTVELSL
jgi:iron complex outermembrane receptor protein